MKISSKTVHEVAIVVVALGGIVTEFVSKSPWAHAAWVPTLGLVVGYAIRFVTIVDPSAAAAEKDEPPSDPQAPSPPKAA